MWIGNFYLVTWRTRSANTLESFWNGRTRLAESARLTSLSPLLPFHDFHSELSCLTRSHANVTGMAATSTPPTKCAHIYTLYHRHPGQVTRGQNRQCTWSSLNTSDTSLSVPPSLSLYIMPFSTFQPHKKKKNFTIHLSDFQHRKKPSGQPTWLNEKSEIGRRATRWRGHRRHGRLPHAAVESGLERQRGGPPRRRSSSGLHLQDV